MRYQGIKKESKSDDPLTKPQNQLKRLCFLPGQLRIKLPDQVIPPGLYGTSKFPNRLMNELVIQNGTNSNKVTFENRFIWIQETLEAELKAGTEVKINTKSLVLSYKKANYSPEVLQI